MRKAWVLILVGILAGCGSQDGGGVDRPDGGGSVDPARFLATPTACTGAAQCKTGEVCANGYCQPPAPTSTSYTVCALDADCPEKDFCSLGVCAHDCVTNQDCASGLVCTSRGRCANPATITQPAPIVAPPAPTLQVSTGATGNGLTFPRGVTQKTIVIRSSNGSPIKFRITSNVSWLSVDRASGEVSTDPVAVAVSVDRSQMSVESQAALSISSDAGKQSVTVFLARDLGGKYAGKVAITDPYSMAESGLTLQLFEGSGGALSGYVEPAVSALFPSKAVVTGSITGTTVSLRFAVAHPAGAAENPWLSRNVKRSITLTGTLSSVGSLAGTVEDDVAGLLPAPIVLKGAFQLERVGAATTGTGDALPSMTFPSATSPFTVAELSSCQSSCGTAENCLRSSATFYDWFQRMLANNGTAFDNLSDANVAQSATINAGNLRCAQVLYFNAMVNGSGATAATGLLDSLEVATDFALLFGNQKMVDAVTAWKTTGSLETEQVTVNAAALIFLGASHPATATAPVTFLDPYVANILGQYAGSSLESGTSNLKAYLNDPSPRQAAEHLRRQLLATSALLRSSVEVANRQHRLGQLTDAQATARRGALGGYLDLALLSQLLRTAGASGLSEMDQALQGFKDLVHEFDALVAGQNPVGLSATYVPFLLDTRGSGTNYQQILAIANGRYQTAGKPAQDKAIQAGREFEGTQMALANQIVAQESQYGQQLMSLCGSTALSDCFRNPPIAGSDLAVASHDVEIASKRVTEAYTRIQNVNAEIAIEVERANAVAGIRGAEAKLLLDDGNTLVDLMWVDQGIDFLCGSINIVADAIQAAASASGLGNWGWGAGGAFAAGAMKETALVISTLGKGLTSEERIKLQALQSARVQWAQNEIDNANSAAVIKSKLLEKGNLWIEYLIAGDSMAQAIDRLDGIMIKAKYLDAERARYKALEGQQVQNMLQYRIYSSDLDLAAQKAFRELMEWAYVATRAAEYELNTTYPSTANLWKARTADEINWYLAGLDDFYVKTKPLAPQYPVDVLSLRDDILDLGDSVTDAVTGQKIDARERFRRYVADPANRDADGNLHIYFSTNRPDKLLFAKTVCDDRIRSLRVNLVGDDLGAGVTYAYVQLAQGGLSHVRSCSDLTRLVDYDLSDRGAQYRTVRVEAGINASNRLAAGQPNTDLILRSVLADRWELVIQGPGLEPANAGLKLLGLDDIELIIEQEAFTGQTH